MTTYSVYFDSLSRCVSTGRSPRLVMGRRTTLVFQDTTYLLAPVWSWVKKPPWSKPQLFLDPKSFTVKVTICSGFSFSFSSCSAVQISARCDCEQRWWWESHCLHSWGRTWQFFFFKYYQSESQSNPPNTRHIDTSPTHPSHISSMNLVKWLSL